MSNSNTTLQTITFNTTLGVGQGPSGPPGPAGAGGVVSEFIAGQPLSGYQLVIINSQNQAELASSNDPGHAFLIFGVTTGSAASGAVVSVQNAGLLEHLGWSWVTGSLIFLGLNGSLVTSSPITAAFSQVIGKAVSPTRILVGIQPPIF